MYIYIYIHIFEALAVKVSSPHAKTIIIVCFAVPKNWHNSIKF